VEIKRDNRNVQNIKRTRLFKKYNIEKLFKKYNIEKEEDLNRLIEELKQKVAAKTQQLSRYRKRQNQYYQNKLFRTDCKNFYNQLRQTYNSVKNVPENQELENFWREIYGNKVEHNRGVLDKKPVPTKFKHGMEPSM
jgi:hypothetical protein